MRVIRKLLLPAVTLAAMMACAPPLPENEAPFIELVSPEGIYVSEQEDTYYFVISDRPTDVVLRFKDRLTVDGDFTVTYALDTTTDADPFSLEGTTLTEVPIDTEITITLPDGFPEGRSDLVVIANDDLGPTGTDEDGNSYDRGQRIARYRFFGELGHAVAISPEDPDTTDDLLGTTPVVQTGPHYAWTWTRDGDADPTLFAEGIQGSLPAANTERGETWTYCVERRDEPPVAGVPRADWEPADVTECASVTIGNAAPSAPTVVISPDTPNTTTPLYCEAMATDPDGDGLTYAYSWTDGTDTVAGQWLSPAETGAGETWQCVPTANDGEDDGPATASANTVAIRAASLTLSGNLVAGGGFDPSAGTQLGVAEVILGTSGDAEVTVVTPDAGECLLFPADTLPSGPSVLTGTTGLSLGQAVATGDIDGNGQVDAAVSEDEAVYLVYDQTIPGGGSVGVSTLTSTSIENGDALDPGFGGSIALGQIRDVAGDNGNLDLAVRWAHAVPPQQVLFFDGDPFARTGSAVRSTGDAYATLDGDGTSTTFGAALATGDFDGDGTDDVAVGDPDGGAVYVFQGGATLNGAMDVSDARYTITEAGSGIGSALAFADLDGDGSDELIIGTPDGGEGSIGVFVASELTANASVAFGTGAHTVIDGSATGDALGTTLAVLRDPSGQFGDAVAVGAPGTSGGNGAVYLFAGHRLLDGAATLGSPDVQTVQGGTSTMLHTGGAGDVDADGFPDLMVVSSPGGSAQFWVLGTDY